MRDVRPMIGEGGGYAIEGDGYFIEGNGLFVSRDGWND